MKSVKTFTLLFILCCLIFSTQPVEASLWTNLLYNNSLASAVKKGDTVRVRKYLRLGASPDTRSHYFHCLSHASAHGYYEIAKSLLDYGARVDGMAKYPQWTPLHYAAQNGHVRIAELLIEKGAKVNARTVWDHHKWTPLHFAAYNGKTDVVKLLIEKGAKVNTLSGTFLNYLGPSQKNDWIGGTPLHLAAHHGYQEIAQSLLDHGADHKIRNHKQQTAKNIAHEWAKIEGDWGCYRLLANLEDPSNSCSCHLDPK